MADQGLDLLLVADPANQNWLTGHEGWSFYTPQLVAVSHHEEPLWLGRAMDAPGARMTVYMADENVIPYPETLVQRPGVHPVDFMAEALAARGYDGKRIGVESDSYFFSAKTLSCLEAGLPNAAFNDDGLLVNWSRAVKSEAEMALMRQAARLAEGSMQAAYQAIAPGVRQCDAVAAVYAAQIGGHPDFGGDMTALCPIVMAGEAATTAHPIWDDRPFEADQTVALELGGACKRYNVGLARTLHLGKPPGAPDRHRRRGGRRAGGGAGQLEGRCGGGRRARRLAGRARPPWPRQGKPHRLRHRRRLPARLGRAHHLAAAPASKP